MKPLCRPLAGCALLLASVLYGCAPNVGGGPGTRCRGIGRQPGRRRRARRERRRHQPRAERRGAAAPIARPATGATGSGGAVTTGGATGKGGATGNGGTTGRGGASRRTGKGGATGTGGTPASGGTTGTAGTTATGAGGATVATDGGHRRRADRSDRPQGAAGGRFAEQHERRRDDRHGDARGARHGGHRRRVDGAGLAGRGDERGRRLRLGGVGGLRADLRQRRRPDDRVRELGLQLARLDAEVVVQGDGGQHDAW